MRKGGEGNKDLCVKVDVEGWKIKFALYVYMYVRMYVYMYVCMYLSICVSSTGTKKVTKQTREKNGTAVFESTVRDIE